MSKISVIIFFFILHFSFASATNTKPNVAIIGAGVGGASLSYYLSELDLDVEIFEKTDRIGGRVKSQYIEDIDPKDNNKKRKVYYEIGATVWAKPCFYIDTLAKSLNVSVIDFAEDDGMEYFVWEGNDSYRFDLTSLSHNTLTLIDEMLKFKQSLAENYISRDLTSVAYDLKHSTYFNTIEEFSRIGNLDIYTNISIYDYFKQKGVDHDYIRQYVDPLTRVIYEQDSEYVNAFAGLTSLISGQDARSAKIGLQNFITKMIEASGYPVHLNSKVEEIRKIGNKYELVIQQKDSRVTKEFDYVVISAPINYATIKFINFTDMEFHKLFENRAEYVTKTVTFVKAKELNEKYFGFKADAIFTSKISDINNVPFFSITVDYVFSNGHKLYSIFSRGPVPYENYFVDPELIHIENWEFTFPYLMPNKEYQPIEPVENLFYINSIEKIAVAMEASVLLSRNIALMIKSRIEPTYDNLSYLQSLVDLTFSVPSLLFGIFFMNFLMKIDMSKPSKFQLFKTSYKLLIYLIYISLHIEHYILSYVFNINLPQELTYIYGVEFMFILLLAISRYCGVLHPFYIISELFINHDINVLIGAILGATFSYVLKEPLNLLLSTISFGIGGFDIISTHSGIVFMIILFLTLKMFKSGIEHYVSSLTTTLIIVLYFIVYILTTDVPYIYKTTHQYMFLIVHVAIPHSLYEQPRMYFFLGAIISTILLFSQRRVVPPRRQQRNEHHSKLNHYKIIGCMALVFNILTFYARSPMALIAAILLI